MQIKTKNQERKKLCLLYIQHFLEEQNYLESLQTLQKESGINFKDFELDSNFSLETLFRDHHDFFVYKYNKQPFYFKLKENQLQNKNRKNNLNQNQISKAKTLPSINHEEQLKIIPQENALEINNQNPQSLNSKTKENYLKERVINIPQFISRNSEQYELARQIQQEIINEDTRIQFEDVVGQQEAKRLILEAVKLPLENKEMFAQMQITPWKGILLYGPPGTGKTMLARAVAKECNTTFFNISASSIVSKYHGESEKCLRILFEMARANQPATIYIDEIDSIIKTRNQQGEHEASWRLKTELLIQLDGLRSLKNEEIFLLCSTNSPWELDWAFLRRLEKRIYVGNLGQAERDLLIKRSLKGFQMSQEINSFEIAERTVNYSGSDLMGLIKEIKMSVLREELKRKNKGKQNWIITKEKLEEALSKVKPMNDDNEDRYLKWQAKFGSI